MKNLLFLAMFLLPLKTLAADTGQSGFNWGEILGSVIVVFIISLGMYIEERKRKKQTNVEKRGVGVNFEKITKFFKTVIVLSALWILSSFIALKLVPDRHDPLECGLQACDMSGARILLALSLVVLTIFVYRAIINKGARNSQKNEK